MTDGRFARCSFYEKPWNFSSSSSRSRYKWLNIPNSGLSMFIGCAYMFCLIRCYLLVHIIVCKTSMLKFSIVLEFFKCSLFKEYQKTHWNSRRLDWTRLGQCEHPGLYSLTGLDWTRLDSTLLVCTHPKVYQANDRTKFKTNLQCGRWWCKARR